MHEIQLSVGKGKSKERIANALPLQFIVVHSRAVFNRTSFHSFLRKSPNSAKRSVECSG